MDHLPILVHPNEPLPQVPFFASTQWFYAGPIEEFGKHLESLHSPESTPESNRTYSSFVQQWLYFGLLSDFFKLWDFDVPQSDFVAQQGGRDVVTNRLLPDYMVAYLAREFSQDQTLLRDKTATNQVATYTAAQKSGALRRMDRGLALFEYVHDRLDQDIESTSIDPALWDSILLLSASLIRFWQHIYGSLRPETVSILPPDFSIFTFRSIPDLRSSGTFCAHEQRLLLDLVDRRLNDIAFFSRLGPNQDGASHVACKPHGCVAYQTDNSAPYHTVHAPDCDGACKSMGLGEDFWIRKAEQRSQLKNDDRKTWGQSFQDMLPEQMKKEALAVTFQDGQLVAQDVALMKTRTAGWINRQMADWNMVVFSHVWADGLGNPGSNTLPACQLERLQHLANSSYGYPKAPVPFWFDTLLIPVKRKGLSDEDKLKEAEAKTHALRDMEWVYKYASKVLVLDKRLFDLDCQDMQPEEVGARIMCSVWSRRLWTLQEGASRNKTYFRFKDEWIHWPDLHEQVLERGKLSNWRGSKSSKLSKSHPLSKSQKVNLMINKKGGDRKVTTSPMVEAKTGADKRIFKVISPVWHTIYRFLEELTIDWSGSTKATALPRCIRGMYYRNCSEIHDEALVLASMISSTPGLATKLTVECKDDFAKRYKMLFSSMKEVPEDFLFIDQARYEVDGERWMPKSLLSVSAKDYRPPARTDKLPSMSRLTARWYRTRHNILCERTEIGIMLGLWGVKLLPCPRPIRAPFRFQWKDKSFIVTLKQPGTENEISDLPEGDWALIFERSASFTEDWKYARAALVKINEWVRRTWSAGGKGIFAALASVTHDNGGNDANTTLPLIAIEEPRTSLNKRVLPLEDRGMQRAVQEWIVG